MLQKVSQETLAEMIGTRRPPVNLLMNKFRKLFTSTKRQGLSRLSFRDWRFCSCRTSLRRDLLRARQKNDLGPPFCNR
jgi:hypothetical protein